MTVAGATASTCNVQLHAIAEGDGTPVVILHGFTGSSASVAEIAAGLRDRHATLRIDLIGHGESDAPRAVAHYSLGSSLMQKGEFTAAITAFREASRLKPDYAEAHCNLGHALSRTGHLREAVESLRKGHELGSQRSDWLYPSKQWVESAERTAKLRDDLEARLPGVLSGKIEPKNAEDCAGLAEVCYRSQRFADAAHLYEKALGMGAPHEANRYNAACAGVLANTPEWRGRALKWLHAELEEHAQDPAAAKATLVRWKRDADFAAVRDRIDSLPESERAGWQKLWADVDALLKRAVAK